MDKSFLLAALEQAALGRGQCAPNPSVGAVAVRNGEIIARAFHKGAGTAHAEVLVFEQLPPNLDGVTLYVTLEPCNHWGRTPPCVNAIIAQGGISEVIYGYCDPNPVVMSNNTPSILAEHGIKSRYMPLEEINAFYESYKHWRHSRKPFVTAKIAQTLDGKIAQANYQAQKISNDICDNFTHQQRKKTDIILTSMRTVNNDDPLLNARINGQTCAKNIAILDSHLQLNPKAKIFDSAKNIHIYYSPGKEPSYQHEKVHYHAVSEASKGLNLEEVIYHLGELGYHDVWVEAGATLFAALHEANLVDRSFIYIAPSILGMDAISAYPSKFLNLQPETKITWSAMGNNSMVCFDWRRK
ncbi:MAG: bifunctional diaminohydroxyphosphoribosylaminopyrimidine deaminase/5-amino-6-(5-phosphoribosylamino)uracil reductase RibD [Proteobacteria bacterium]|nr:bifunctional diaminohydroxyphosphoribosylaminopyrimidine deaminase/5-amino-6-(5-phosphoribosylamino)uracil reductase RibD [Pseudomonadota bacterium]